ncbi:hypothetical protein DY000_02007564 [Brassica cretica]|uniref:Uncharacterized protein n=1 Tax=Brassica cretica TaxID=69181 RepID=A0ABQ7C5V0_BRACR|nr:hypothetical protein DY000_02007564 [Brassica cretica]
MRPEASGLRHSRSCGLSLLANDFYKYPTPPFSFKRPYHTKATPKRGSFKVLKFDTLPGSPKNCLEAKEGSVRVQIIPSRPVSFFMIKERFCASRDQSSQDIKVGFWLSPLRSTSCFSPRTL